MTPKNLCILVLAVIATSTVAGQNEDIPIENDNQFPPENPSDSDGAIIEGSGDGTGEELPLDAATETPPVPLLEDVQPPETQSVVTTPAEENLCPNPCVCHFEGGSENFIVDCSNFELEEFPFPIDPKTTTLNLQNNKLTEIPKAVASLKSLKVLNAHNNSIMDLALGSISELPELTVLKLSNNRLIEYPQELKNSILLTKLEELDLGENDMRTELKPDTFLNFQALRNLTLATSSRTLVLNLCGSLKGTLETVCTESCEKQAFTCDDAPQVLDDDLLDATLPGMIPFEGDDIVDPVINSANVNLPQDQAIDDDLYSKSGTEEPLPTNEGAVSVASGRSIVNKESVIEAPKDVNIISDKKEILGAATTESKTGGVDKSVIGIIVAGMVVVIAGITIKKNWSSIKKRFSSTPRPAERNGTNANGTAPEEVPLQDKDKSPV